MRTFNFDYKAPKEPPKPDYERKKVKQDLTLDLGYEAVAGGIKGLITYLLDIGTKHGFDLKVETHYDDDGYRNYDDVYVQLPPRDETDEEYNSRVRSEEAKYNNYLEKLEEYKRDRVKELKQLIKDLEKELGEEG